MSGGKTLLVECRIIILYIVVHLYIDIAIIYSEMYIWPFTNNDVMLQLYLTSVYYVLPEGDYKHYLKHVEVVSLYTWTNAVSWK
jgi:hypothetical protein